MNKEPGMTQGLALAWKGALAAAVIAWAAPAAIAQQTLPRDVLEPPAATVAPEPVVVAPPTPGELEAGIPIVPGPDVPAGQSDPEPMRLYERTMPTPGIGQPVPAGIALQQQVTPIGLEAKAMMERVLNPIIGLISLFVLGLMIWVAFRYRAARVQTPSATTHNFTIEVIWTLVPALILLFIAFPSFRLLANQYSPPEADLTIKVTGFQWYWGYEYPDYGDFGFDSVPLTREEADAEGTPYLLEVDNRLVVPAGRTVKLLITAADVLHSFAVPSFWLKMDAVPGRINETWFRVDRPGVYYGQCSELCGTRHGFMPIAVEVLPEAEFLAWVRARQAADGIDPTGPGIAAPEPQAQPLTVDAAPAAPAA
jgi:cytochrome c oxidase subunit 2